MSDPKETNDEMELTTEEQDLYNESAGIEPEPTPEPEKAASEDDAAVETPEAPREERPVPQTIEELQARVQEFERTESGLRREVDRQRARNLLLRQQVPASTPQPGAQTQPLPTPAQDEDEDIPVVMDDDGNLRVKRADLAKLIERPPLPQQREQSQANNLMNYESWKEDFVSKQEKPEVAREAIGELEDAYRWVDLKFGASIREAGINPVSLGGPEGVLRWCAAEGIREEFEAEWGSKTGIDFEDLLLAPAGGPVSIAREVRRHVQRRSSGTAPVSSDKSKPRPHALRGDRPRSMAGRGRTQEPASALQRYADLPPDDFLSMTDEQYEEVKREVKRSSSH